MNTRLQRILSRRHRERVWGTALWIIAGALIADCIALLLGVGARGQVWLAGIAIVSAVLSRILLRQSLASTAQSLDKVLAAQSRLEAAVELHRRSDALASALQQEADRFLASARVPVSIRWYAAWLVIAMAATVRLALVEPAAPPPAISRAHPAAAAAEAPKPIAMPAAYFRWVSPPPAIRASADEVVPLKAEAQSDFGLGKVVLHLFVNGQAVGERPVAEATGQGPASLHLDLPLAPLSLSVHDAVSYYLEADRLSPTGTVVAGWKKATSALQFIQIRSGQPDTSASTSAGSEAVESLKAEANRLSAELFDHSHAESVSTDPDVLRKLAAEYRQLASRARSLATHSPGIDPASKAALLKAADAYEQAAERIGAGELSAASNRAQAAAAEMSKAPASSRIASADSASAAAPQPMVAYKPASTDVPKEAPAEALARLAKEQASIAQKIAAGASGPDLVRNEARLAQEAEALSENKDLSNEQRGKLRQAATAAHTAAQQLSENDPSMAREPAQVAATALQEAGKNRLPAENVHLMPYPSRHLFVQAASIIRSPGTGPARQALTLEIQGEQALQALVDRLQAQLVGKSPEGNSTSYAMLRRFQDFVALVHTSHIRPEIETLARAPHATDEQRQAVRQKLLELADSISASQRLLLKAAAAILQANPTTDRETPLTARHVNDLLKATVSRLDNEDFVYTNDDNLNETEAKIGQRSFRQNGSMQSDDPYQRESIKFSDVLAAIAHTKINDQLEDIAKKGSSATQDARVKASQILTDIASQLAKDQTGNKNPGPALQAVKAALDKPADSADTAADQEAALQLAEAALAPSMSRQKGDSQPQTPGDSGTSPDNSSPGSSGNEGSEPGVGADKPSQQGRDGGASSSQPSNSPAKGAPGSPQDQAPQASGDSSSQAQTPSGGSPSDPGNVPGKGSGMGNTGSQGSGSGASSGGDNPGAAPQDETAGNSKAPSGQSTSGSANGDSGGQARASRGRELPEPTITVPTDQFPPPAAPAVGRPHRPVNPTQTAQSMGSPGSDDAFQAPHVGGPPKSPHNTGYYSKEGRDHPGNPPRSVAGENQAMVGVSGNPWNVKREDLQRVEHSLEVLAKTQGDDGPIESDEQAHAPEAYEASVAAYFEALSKASQPPSR